MKQEEILRCAAEGGLSGGFVIGKKLPQLKGNLKGFYIKTLNAIEKEVPSNFIIRIIETFDEKPLRNNEARSRRLKELIITSIGVDKKFILIVEDAHLLAPSTLYRLKSFHEIGSDINVYPGIVLLGDTKKIVPAVIKEKGIALRALIFSSTGFQSIAAT